MTLESVVLRPMIEAEVPARATGVLARLEVQEGAAVKEGDTLASLDDRGAALAVQKAGLERAQAAAKASNRLRTQYADKALEVARAEMKRSGESNAQFAKSISQSQLDVERLTVEKLELEREQAEHDIALDKFELELKETALDAAKLDLELHAVRAPFSGVVALIRARAGEWVQPGTPILRLVSVDVLRAEGFAAADAAGSLQVGAPVQFLAEATEKTVGLDVPPVKGSLRFVSPEIDPVTRQVRVWAEIDNTAHRLRPGQQGRMMLGTLK